MSLLACSLGIVFFPDEETRQTEIICLSSFLLLSIFKGDFLPQAQMILNLHQRWSSYIIIFQRTLGNTSWGLMSDKEQDLGYEWS